METIEIGYSFSMKHRYWALLIIFFSICFTNVSKGTAEPVQKLEPLIELNEENWRLMFKGEWMVEFYAPWCPACKNLSPTWETFAISAAKINVNVAKIDVTTSPSLSGRFYVTALPTIYHVKDGEFRQYRGSREEDALMLFIREKQWSKLEPISAWKKPDTLHMSVLSYFFKLSHTLKDFNGRLQQEYGLPTWGSYALFTIGTVFVGAALGLMLVCVVDFIYPPKKLQRQSFSESRENSQNDIEDIANDEIEDDRPQYANDDDDGEVIDEENNDNENDVVSANDDKQSDPEVSKNEIMSKKEVSDNKSSPTEVRKRKPRKAD